MRFKLASLLTLCLGFLFSDVTQNQTVQISVGPINELSIANNDPDITISSSDVDLNTGDLESPVSNSNTYSFTVIDTQTKKITARLDQALPSNVELFVTLTTPSGGTSSRVQLDNTPKTIVSGINASSKASALTIYYQMQATSSAIPMNARPAQAIYSLENDS